MVDYKIAMGNNNCIMRVIRFISRTIVNEFIFILVSVLLLSIPAGYGAIGDYHYFQKFLFLTSTITSTTFCVFCVVGIELCRNKRIKVICKAIFLFFCIMLFLIETFVYKNFNARVTPLIISLILQTDKLEATLFLQTYVYTISSIKVLFLFIVFGVILAFFNKVYKKLIKKTVVVQKIIGVSFMFISLFGISLPIINAKSFYTAPIGLNTIEQVLYSFNNLGNYKEIIDSIYEANNTIEITSKPDSSPIIVCVIGESFIKRHSSLYGYPLITNPNLLNEKIKGNLYIFNDVVTTSMWTAKTMENIFSVSSVNEDDNFENTPLFPAVFKKAGFSVAYIDNQITRATGKKEYDYAAVYFLNPLKLHRQCFDYRNEVTYRLDGDAITNNINFLYHEKKSLNIIHLRGQHYPQSADYPNTNEWNKIKSNDIVRADLNEEQKIKVAHYDNSTLYNDFVLKQIIDEFRNDNAVIVYFSDHGEQVYDDDRLKYGRTATDVSVKDIKPLWEIPFFIWVSDKFKEKCPEKTIAIQNAVDLPFSNDDISLLLFDLADINFVGNKPDRSVINKDFKKRDRILLMGDKLYNYDKNRKAIEKIVLKTPKI